MLRGRDHTCPVPDSFSAPNFLDYQLFTFFHSFVTRYPPACCPEHCILAYLSDRPAAACGESFLTLLRPAAAIHEGSRQSNAAASPVLTSSDCTALSSAVGTSLLAPKLACKLTNQLFRDFFLASSTPATRQAQGELKTALRMEEGRRRKIHTAPITSHGHVPDCHPRRNHRA